jgi:hypothetical protein
MSPVLSLELPQHKKHSLQMRSVLLIFAADPHLANKVEPFINLETEDISWDGIFRAPLSTGQKAAAYFAFGIWRDEPKPKVNIFDDALYMEPKLKYAVLSALAVRWGLMS